jgi:hypothetical protein
MARDLASRGFIVAVVGSESPDCARPDGAITSSRAGEMDFSSSAAFARTVEIANTKIVRVAASATKVLDALESLDRDDSRGRFTARLDLSRIATIGHSLGGAIALQAACSILESRLRSTLTGGYSTPRAADGRSNRFLSLVAMTAQLRRPIRIRRIQPSLSVRAGPGGQSTHMYRVSKVRRRGSDDRQREARGGLLRFAISFPPRRFFGTSSRRSCNTCRGRLRRHLSGVRLPR